MNTLKTPTDVAFRQVVGKFYALTSFIRRFNNPGLDGRWSFSIALFCSRCVVNNLKKILAGLTQNSLRSFVAILIGCGFFNCRI